MRATSLSIRNVRGIEALTIDDLGAITVLEGANGVGKSSALDALRLLQEPNEQRIKLGAKQATIILRLDNGWTITRKIGAGAGLTITDADGVELAKPAARLQQLLDALSFSPVRFTQCTGKERLDALLSLVNDDETATEVEGLVKGVEEFNVMRKQHGEGLADFIDRIRKQLYSDRRSINRTRKEADGAVKRLSEAVDEKEFGDGCCEDRMSEPRQVLKILRQQQDAKIEKIRKTYAGKIERATAAVAKAESSWENHSRLHGTYDQLVREKERRDLLGERSDRYTEALGAVDAKKAELVNNLGVDGLAWNDEAADLQLQDVPFGELSTSQQMQTAMHLCTHRSGDLRLVCVDGLEALDTEAQKALEAFAEREKVQIIGARVTDAGELMVTGDSA